MAFCTVHYSARGSGPRRRRRGHVETLGETLDDLGEMDKATMVVLRLTGPAADWGHLIEPATAVVPDPADPPNTKVITVAYRRYRVALTTLLNRINGSVRDRITRRMGKVEERNAHLNDSDPDTGRGPNANDKRRQKRRNFGPRKTSHLPLVTEYDLSLTTLNDIEQAIDDDYPYANKTIPLIDDAAEIIDDDPQPA